MVRIIIIIIVFIIIVITWFIYWAVKEGFVHDTHVVKLIKFKLELYKYSGYNNIHSLVYEEKRNKKKKENRVNTTSISLSLQSVMEVVKRVEAIFWVLLEESLPRTDFMLEDTRLRTFWVWRRTPIFHYFFFFQLKFSLSYIILMIITKWTVFHSWEK